MDTLKFEFLFGKFYARISQINIPIQIHSQAGVGGQGQFFSLLDFVLG